MFLYLNCGGVELESLGKSTSVIDSLLCMLRCRLPLGQNHFETQLISNHADI